LGERPGEAMAAEENGADARINHNVPAWNRVR
jgi:hypothetical protein